MPRSLAGPTEGSCPSSPAHGQGGNESWSCPCCPPPQRGQPCPRSPGRRNESVLEGHSCTVWVEQSCNLFPRRLHSLQSLFIYFSSWNTAITCSPTPPHPGLPHVGRGHSHPRSVPGWQHSTQPGPGAPPGTDVTPRSQELTTSFIPGPQGTCTPIATPVLRGTPRVWQSEGTRGAQQSDTAWLGHWRGRGRRSWEDAGRSLRAPPGSVAVSVQAEMVSPPVPSEMQV